MPLVRVNDVEVTSRHLDIPETCPGCGSKTSTSVEEINLVEEYLAGSFEVEDADSRSPLYTFEPIENASWAYGESSIVVGYRCRSCRRELVTGSFSETEGE